MGLDAYTDWISIYDDEFQGIWTKEPTELRKLSILYCAIQREFENIQNQLKKQFESAKKHVNDNATSYDTNKENVNLRQSPTIKKLKYPVMSLKKIKMSTTKESILESSLKQNEATTPCNDLLDPTIIDGTPQAPKIKKDRPKKTFTFSKKSRKESKKPYQHTLTQIFNSTENTLSKTMDGSMAIDDVLKVINDDNNIVCSDSDETCVEYDGPENDSKKLSLSPNFLDGYDNIPEKKSNEPDYVYVEEVVRGKERKKLQGWACKDCELFYKNLNLPPDEIKKKMDECSRHRYKFAPDPETAPGFWDITFAPTQEADTSMVFEYKK